MATCTGPQRVMDAAPVQFPSASDFVPEDFVVGVVAGAWPGVREVVGGPEGTVVLGGRSVESLVARSSEPEPEDCEA